MHPGIWAALAALYPQRGGAGHGALRCWRVHCWHVIYLGEEGPKASAGCRVMPGLQGLKKERARQPEVQSVSSVWHKPADMAAGGFVQQSNK